MLTMSLTSKTHPYKAGFEPFATDIYRLPFRLLLPLLVFAYLSIVRILLRAHIEDTFKRVVAAESVAAIVVEPVLGEGGFVAPPPEFLPMLQEICHRHGILLIADEVQTGIGRTGTMFACEAFGIVPDILVTAKSLGGRFAARARSRDAPKSWTPRAWAASAARLPAIPWRAPRPWQ